MKYPDDIGKEVLVMYALDLGWADEGRKLAGQVLDDRGNFKYILKNSRDELRTYAKWIKLKEKAE